MIHVSTRRYSSVDLFALLLLLGLRLRIKWDGSIDIKTIPINIVFIASIFCVITVSALSFKTCSYHYSTFQDDFSVVPYFKPYPYRFPEEVISMPKSSYQRIWVAPINTFHCAQYVLCTISVLICCFCCVAAYLNYGRNVNGIWFPQGWFVFIAENAK